jgi:hypothetical protein
MLQFLYPIRDLWTIRYFEPEKYTLWRKINNFSQFHISQLFSADSISKFVFVLPMKIWKTHPQKKHRNKTEEIFRTALAAQSAQKQKDSIWVLVLGNVNGSTTKRPFNQVKIANSKTNNLTKLVGQKSFPSQHPNSLNCGFSKHAWISYGGYDFKIGSFIVDWACGRAHAFIRTHGYDAAPFSIFSPVPCIIEKKSKTDLHRHCELGKPPEGP